MKPQKAIIFDTGTLITLSMTCLLDLLINLKKEFNGKFLITKLVEQEMFTRPLEIKKYKLGAMRLKQLLDEKIIECPDCIGINSKEINIRTNNYLKSANNIFYKKNQPLHLIDQGEAACLALSSILTEKGIKNVIAIDEKTTRMLCEKPENLKLLMERKLHTKLTSKTVPNEFKQFHFIRSAELVYIGFKKNLFNNNQKDFLDALLYAVKFKGCAITNEEITALERL
jgi:hypothetical protein